MGLGGGAAAGKKTRKKKKNMFDEAEEVAKANATSKGQDADDDEAEPGKKEKSEQVPRLNQKSDNSSGLKSVEEDASLRDLVAAAKERDTPAKKDDRESHGDGEKKDETGKKGQKKKKPTKIRLFG